MSRLVALLLVICLASRSVAHGTGDSLLYVRGEIGCQSSDIIHSHDSCSYLGTAEHPALSCEHLKTVCDEAASGYYFIQTAGIYRKVYCEMDIQGGGWARYGQSDQGTTWNYVDENVAEITLEIISPFDVKEMIDLKYNRFLIQTDVVFKLQGDDSVNPSRLTTRSIPWLEETSLFIPGNANDHTRIEFVEGSVDRVTCIPGGSSKCGQGGGLPPARGQSQPFFFQSLYFGPRASGASAHQDQWQRNRFTWNGSYYYVYAK